MIFDTKFIMPFGVNEGHSLAEIYKYVPSYIEWLIEYIPEFEIDIEQFEKLGTSTVYVYDSLQELKLGSGETIQLPLHIQHNNSVSIIKNLKQHKEIQFCFSENTKHILQMKASGNYIPPKWQKLTPSETVEFELIMKYLKNDILNIK